MHDDVQGLLVLAVGHMYKIWTLAYLSFLGTSLVLLYLEARPAEVRRWGYHSLCSCRALSRPITRFEIESTRVADGGDRTRTSYSNRAAEKPSG